jgi:CheY-like chemotaxis protein
MAEPGSRPHILVIDDEPAMRQVLGEILGDEGYRVTTLDGAFVDIDSVVALAPDLIVLDFVLQGRSALDFIDQLNADPRTDRLPIAVCTAALHRTEEIRARLDQWDCLLIPKPFDVDELINEINRCLAGHNLAPSTS